MWYLEGILLKHRSALSARWASFWAYLRLRTSHGPEKARVVFPLVIPSLCFYSG